MAWTRIGDNVVTHPLISQLLTACDFDHARKNEAFGAFVFLGTVSAAHLTDYVVEYGLVAQIAPGREKVIIDTLVSAGMAARIEIDGRPMLKLTDVEELLHNRSREEVELDRRRMSDRRNQDIILPVRVRDGDQCRWCGKTVDWKDRKSSRSATIDSLNGHRDSTEDTLVVACKGCNSQRGAGVVLELRDPPTPDQVYYSDHTISYINATQWAKDNGVELLPRQTRLTLTDPVSATGPDESPVPGAAREYAAASASRGRMTTPLPQQQANDPGAAREYAAASDICRAARGVEESTQDPLADAPDWVREAMEEIHQPPRAAREYVAAPGEDGGHKETPLPQQQANDPGAAREYAAASDICRAARGVEESTQDPLADAPDWVREAMEEIHQPPRAAREYVAAPGEDGGHKETPLPQQQANDPGAAREHAAAPDICRAARGVADPQPSPQPIDHNPAHDPDPPPCAVGQGSPPQSVHPPPQGDSDPPPVYNDSITSSTDLVQIKNKSRSDLDLNQNIRVTDLDPSGRDGTGRDRQWDQRRRRRRGKRSNRNDLRGVDALG